MMLPDLLTVLQMGRHSALGGLADGFAPEAANPDGVSANCSPTALPQPGPPE